jgi:hypothetical protein
LAGVSLRNINAQLGDTAQLSDIEGQAPILGSEIDNRLAESTSLLAAHPSLQLLQQQENDLESDREDAGGLEERFAAARRSAQGRQRPGLRNGRCLG